MLLEKMSRRTRQKFLNYARRYRRKDTRLGTEVGAQDDMKIERMILYEIIFIRNCF